MAWHQWRIMGSFTQSEPVIGGPSFVPTQAWSFASSSDFLLDASDISTPTPRARARSYLRARGRPRPAMAMMSRCTSLTPPPKVSVVAER